MFSFFKKIREFFGILTKDYDSSNFKTNRIKKNFEITKELLDHQVRLSKMDVGIVHQIISFIENSKDKNFIDIMDRAIKCNVLMIEKMIAFFRDAELYLDWKNHVKDHVKLFEYISNEEEISKKFLIHIPRVFSNDCLIVAARDGNFNLFKYIVENLGASVLYQQGKPMRAAIITGNNESYITKEDRLNIVKYCIEDKGCPAYICAYDGLKKACKHGLYKIVRFFVEECDCRVDLYKNYLLNNSTDEIKRYLSEKINENSSNLACSQ